MVVFDFLWEGAWALDTNGVDGTTVIAASFIFLAYFLQPVVTSAFQRVRAYRAWAAIENHQTVEVTKYPLAAEVFGGRGRWDAARIITVLLAVFSLASWGLELSVGLAYYEGDADILNRPPPVAFVRCTGDHGSGRWQVIPKRDFDCEGRGCKSLSNVYDDYAESMYNVVGNSTCHPGYVSGKIRVAFWSTAAEAAPTRLFYSRGVTSAVSSLQCSGQKQPYPMAVYHGNDEWGSVVDCNKGPEPFGLRDEHHRRSTITPPTIVLTRNDGKVYLIVEESSNYPSFLYSVWTAGHTHGNCTDLHHQFHIAATMRLVQAVVTGIVHGNPSGQYSFKLVRMWSVCGERCDREVMRARPFGEHLTNDTVKIQNLETLQCGLQSNADTLLCLACLVLLTVVGVATSLCLRDGVGMDVYDRDELIRAVSMTGVQTGSTSTSAIRVFVHKENTGNVSVVVSDRSNAQIVHQRIRTMGDSTPVENVDPGPIAGDESQRGRGSGGAPPVPIAAEVPRRTRGPGGAAPGPIAAEVSQRSKGYGGGPVRTRSRRVWVPRKQTVTAKELPERRGSCPTFVALTLSPVPSNSGQVVQTPLEDFHALGVSELTHPDSPWERAATSFFPGDGKEGEPGST